MNGSTKAVRKAIRKLAKLTKTPGVRTRQVERANKRLQRRIEVAEKAKKAK